MKEYIWIFTRRVDEFNVEAAFISDKNEKRFCKKRDELLSKGYELLFDSATSLEHAIEYCEEYGAYPECCVNCGTYTYLALYRGKKYDSEWYRYIPFNGYLCEMCGTEGGDLQVRRIADYKPKLS